MSRYMSVDELCKMLKEIGVEDLNVVMEVECPGPLSKHYIGNAWSGCGYPPYSHKIIYFDDPPEIHFRATGKIHPKDVT